MSGRRESSWCSFLLATFIVVSCWSLSGSSSSTDDDLLPFDSSILREKNLFEIAGIFTSLYPDEIEQSLQQLTTDLFVFEKPVNILIEILKNLTADQNRGCGLCMMVVRYIQTNCTQNNDTWDKCQNWTIALCHSVVRAINFALRPQVPIKADPLCDGTINIQAPHIRRVLEENVRLRDFCEKLNSCFPSDRSSSVVVDAHPVTSSRRRQSSTETARRRRSWTVRGPRPAAVPSDAIKVVQLTDIHVEPDYAIGSPTDCGLPVCCIDKWNETGKGFAPPYGTYTCNIPQATIDLFLDKVKSIIKPDVVLFSGDAPPHTVWEETLESQINCTRLVLDSIQRNLSGHFVYPCLGNHETYPTNLNSKKYLPQTTDFLSQYAALWVPVANFKTEQITSIEEGGYYSILLRSGSPSSPALRLLVFNSDYMYTLNWYNVLNHQRQLQLGEVDKMKQFMRDTLRNASSNNEKVILLGHHPIGGADYIVSESRWYQSLVLQYSDIIVLQPTGHTHVDEFRLIYNATTEPKEPKSVVYVSPSMNAGGTTNPSMRVYYLNTTTYELLDYEQWYIDLQPEESGQDITTPSDLIKLLYSAKDSYGLPDLTPQSWHDYVDRLSKDSQLAKNHKSHSDAAARDGYICLTSCQQDLVCRLRNGDYDKYTACKSAARQALQTTVDPNATTTTTTQAAAPPGGVNLTTNNSVLLLLCLLLCQLSASAMS